MNEIYEIKNPISPECITHIRINQLFDGIAGRVKGSTLQNIMLIVDSRVPRWMWPGLVVHEWSELKFELQGHTYPGSHEMATAVERGFVGEKLWPKYDGFYHNLLAVIEDGPKGRDPIDMYYGHSKGPIGGLGANNLPVNVRIGDLYAKRIELLYKNWVLTVKNNSQALTNVAWLPFDPTKLISQATYASKFAQAKAIETRLGAQGLALNLRSASTEKWIADYAAQDIKYIDTASKQTIKSIILNGFQAGDTAVTQAKAIRAVIGLTPQQSLAVQNYMQNLGIDDDARVWDLGEAYAQNLINYRAETIALTEGHIASNEGYLLENADAVDRGVLDPDVYEYKWLVTDDDRLCEICSAHEDDRADLPDGQFEGAEEPAKVHNRCVATDN